MTTTPTTVAGAFPIVPYRRSPGGHRLARGRLRRRALMVHPPDPDAPLVHAEIRVGTGIIMVSDPGRADESPFSLPAPLALHVVVDDPDALHARAVAAGAEIVRGLTDRDYGSREFAARDGDGNLWSFGTYRPEIPPP